MRNRPDPTRRLAGLRTPPGAVRGSALGPADPVESIPDPPARLLTPITVARPEPHDQGGWVPEFGPAPSRTRARHLAAEPGSAEPEPDDAEDNEPGPADSPEPEPEPEPEPDAVQPVPRTGRRRHDPRRPWGRLAGRWVPEPLRDSRIDPGKRGALLLTLIAAIAALVAAIGVWRDRPEPRPVQAVALSQADAGTGPAVTRSTALSVVRATSVSTAPATASTPTVIVVSVTGAVHRPGLVRLPTGSRVADAIERAGGTTAEADLTGLNLAQRLADGASVVVADGTGGSAVTGAVSEATPGATSPAGADAAAVNLNTADVAALDALPGVGPVTAANIVAWREKNGHFSSVEQLQEIPGIGPARFASLAPLVTV